MRILLCVRHDYDRKFAADSIQVIKLSNLLKKLGEVVHINSGEISDFSSYDIVHLFGLNNTGEIYKYFKMAIRYKNNIVLSPNYWDYSKYYKYKGDAENLKLWSRCRPYKFEIIKKSKSIIYNSILEKELIENNFNVSGGSKVVRYGVEVEDDAVPLYSFKDRYNLERYVLSVAKITESKNQFNIAKACAELKLPLVLIGGIIDKNYFKKCMELENVKYFGFMDSYNIYNAYRFAALHVTGGFGEMPGLSCMEAAASGCNILLSNDGCANEYFGNRASYFDPYEEEGLINGIEKTLSLRKNNKLKKFINETYTWEKYAQEVLEEYRRVIESNT